MSFALAFFTSDSFPSGWFSSPLAQAAVEPVNSQTMALPSPALNIDPNPAMGGGDITVADGAALVPQEGPEGTIADVQSQPTNSQISVYTVRDGDTLSQIAAMFNVSVNTIIWANSVQHGVIHPGETLIILPVTGIEHTVVKGETLASLAAKYRSDAGDIASYNDLAVNASLSVGQVVIIPDGELPAPSTSSSSSSGKSGSSSKPSSGSSSEPYLGGSGPSLAGYFGWPLPSSAGIVTQGLHGWNAVDIGAPTGTSILAAAGGTVIVAKSGGAWNGGYGNYVVIAHPNGTQTLYAHMSRVIAQAGQVVGQGDIIGKVGATGEATGPHIHFEVRGAKNSFAYLPLGSGDPL